MHLMCLETHVAHTNWARGVFVRVRVCVCVRAPHVSRGTHSNWDFGLIWISTEEFEFRDLVDFGDVAFSKKNQLYASLYRSCVSPFLYNTSLHTSLRPACLHITAHVPHVSPHPNIIWVPTHQTPCVSTSLYDSAHIMCLHTWKKQKHPTEVRAHMHMRAKRTYVYMHMGWLRLVGSLKFYVSFAKSPIKQTISCKRDL